MSHSHLIYPLCQKSTLGCIQWKTGGIPEKTGATITADLAFSCELLLNSAEILRIAASVQQVSNMDLSVEGQRRSSPAERHGEMSRWSPSYAPLRPTWMKFSSANPRSLSGWKHCSRIVPAWPTLSTAHRMLPPSWAIVVRKGRPVSLPLFFPGMEEYDNDPILLSNFFTPLEKLTELLATCSCSALEQSALPNTRSRKCHTPPTSKLVSQGKHPRCSSPSSGSFSESWPPLPAPQPRFPRPNVVPIPSTLNDDVICAGDFNPSSTVTDSLGSSHLFLSPNCRSMTMAARIDPLKFL